jgi:hypothetical protein
MEKETIKNIFDFLEKVENKNKPFLWKHINNIPLTEKDLNIGGNLDLTGIDIESLPDGLTVRGNLNLIETDMKTLPERLEVAGWLYVNNTSIKSLPEGLKVDGDLDISYTHIESLPRGLKVGGDLYLNDTDLVNSIDYNDSSDLGSIIKKMIDPNDDGDGYIKGNIWSEEQGLNWLEQ